ncbi:hypothetical protein [Thomasclavelia sp.]|uniref:PTS sugar transporter subunit IIA n=1 Tax=Thomasclavelia sp. TaxID=3025757 RepID=UPI0025D60531|nr:hypothetical protein [Thomasclavelia sp.]
MLKLFISSHGHFASGMKSSLNILIGNSDKITIFDAYVDETSVKEALDNFYTTVSKDDQVILLSDLYGGSVNATMCLYLEKPNTMLVTGINLALVLELVLKEKISREELEEIVENSRTLLTIVDLKPIEENDFFED